SRPCRSSWCRAAAAARRHAHAEGRSRSRAPCAARVQSRAHASEVSSAFFRIACDPAHRDTGSRSDRRPSEENEDGSHTCRARARAHTVEDLAGCCARGIVRGGARGPSYPTATTPAPQDVGALALARGAAPVTATVALKLRD